MNFKKWLDTLIEEKGYNLEQYFEIEIAGSEFGVNYLPLSAVIEAIKNAGSDEKRIIKNNLVKIDCANGDCLDYLKHLSQALAR